jgi:hypothetical protein
MALLAKIYRSDTWNARDGKGNYRMKGIRIRAAVLSRTSSLLSDTYISLTKSHIVGNALYSGSGQAWRTVSLSGSLRRCYLEGICMIKHCLCYLGDISMVKHSPCYLGDTCIIKHRPRYLGDICMIKHCLC